jgi:HicB-like protein involved in pilus formation
MNLTPYVAALRNELANAADLGGPDARALAERLTVPMESAVRLALLDALAAAADEITRDLAPGSVQVRLRDREPSFIVTVPPPDDLPSPAPFVSVVPDDEGSVSRINLRLPDQLKGRIEEAAARDGLSVNAWLVRAAAAAVQTEPATTQRAPVGGQRFTGWVR